MSFRAKMEVEGDNIGRSLRSKSEAQFPKFLNIRKDSINTLSHNGKQPIIEGINHRFSNFELITLNFFSYPLELFRFESSFVSVLCCPFPSIGTYFLFNLENIESRPLNFGLQTVVIHPVAPQPSLVQFANICPSMCFPCSLNGLF